MWVSEKVCLDPQAYFEMVFEAISRARKSIVLEMYIFRLDDLGLKMLRQLRQAAARGVVVRMIVDGFGSPEFDREFVTELKKQKVLARVFHPTPRMLDLFGVPSLQRVGQVLSNLNKRNHRKLIVVDDDMAFVGSCNISGLHRNWRETAVCLQGAQVSGLGKSFELIWSRASYSGLSRTRKLRARLRSRRSFSLNSDKIAQVADVRTNITRPLRLRHNAELATLIEKSTKRVWITTAYFVPSPVIVAALLKATRNGSEVKLLLPGISDVTAVSYVSRMFYRGLMLAGVQIFEYQPVVLHAKTLIVDDWVSVGTTNINHRSFYHDLEVDVTLFDTDSKSAMADQFQRDLEVSQRITLDRLMQRSWAERLGGYLMYPFRRFI